MADTPTLNWAKLLGCTGAGIFMGGILLRNDSSPSGQHKVEQVVAKTMLAVGAVLGVGCVSKIGWSKFGPKALESGGGMATAPARA